MWERDNTSALAWAASGKMKALGGQMANIAVTWAQLYGRFNVDSTLHLAGVNMGDVNGATQKKCSPRHLHRPGAEPWSNGADRPVQSCQGCEPSQYPHSVRKVSRSPAEDPEPMEAQSPKLSATTGAEASVREAHPRSRPASTFNFVIAIFTR